MFYYCKETPWPSQLLQNKAINWWFADIFRGLVHYHHDRVHGTEVVPKSYILILRQRKQRSCTWQSWTFETSKLIPNARISPRPYPHEHMGVILIQTTTTPQIVGTLLRVFEIKYTDFYHFIIPCEIVSAVLKSFHTHPYFRIVPISQNLLPRFWQKSN